MSLRCLKPACWVRSPVEHPREEQSALRVRGSVGYRDARLKRLASKNERV
jgi:hypothetical protein